MRCALKAMIPLTNKYWGDEKMPVFTSANWASKQNPSGKKMMFCPYCGTKLDDGARFCKNCGEAISGNDQGDRKFRDKEPLSGNPTERKTVYEGYVYKCPNCGEVLDSFAVNCPTCGYELRGSAATSSVQRLYWELNRAVTAEQKAMIIRNYPIPNSKEDIIEFMILASSNIGGELDNGVFEAWIAKFEQAYQKAQLTLKNDPVFSQIEEIYEKTEKTIALEKISHSTANAGNMVKTYFHAMPNPVFAIVAVFLIFFNLIRLFNGQFSGIDIIFDAILLSVAYNLTEEKAKKAKRESDDLERTSETYDDKIKVPPAIVTGTSENYVVIETLFTQAGFRNVRSIPLHDLTFGVKNKPGTVDKITINGKELSSYLRKKFDADIPIVITYHSMRN